jgi:hypothetical protein
MLRTASSLPPKELSTLGSDPARFQTKPPACYRASWQLPGPDSHRQATTSLRTRRSTMALRHGATSGSAGRTENVQWIVGVSAKEYSRLEDFDQSEAAALLPFATARAPDYDWLLRAAVLGARPVADCPAGYVIRSVGARTDAGDPVTVESLGGPLTLEGVNQVEHLLSFQVINSGAKSQYDS